jgi:hypothetical protein
MTVFIATKGLANIRIQNAIPIFPIIVAAVWLGTVTARAAMMEAVAKKP